MLDIQNGNLPLGPEFIRYVQLFPLRFIVCSAAIFYVNLEILTFQISF